MYGVAKRCNSAMYRDSGFIFTTKDIGMIRTATFLSSMLSRATIFGAIGEAFLCRLAFRGALNSVSAKSVDSGKCVCMGLDGMFG